jgi:hypothetical protein
MSSYIDSCSDPLGSSPKDVRVPTDLRPTLIRNLGCKVRLSGAIGHIRRVRFSDHRDVERSTPKVQTCTTRIRAGGCLEKTDMNRADRALRLAASVGAQQRRLLVARNGGPYRNVAV